MVLFNLTNKFIPDVVCRYGAMPFVKSLRPTTLGPPRRSVRWRLTRSGSFADDGHPPQAVGRKCTNNVSNNISRRGETHDTQPCGRCQCHGPNTRPPESYDGGSGDRSPTRDASTPSARISAARITRGSHDEGTPADPRLEVLLSFKTPGVLSSSGSKAPSRIRAPRSRSSRRTCSTTRR